ncbi:MAG: poly-gamma-glutamate biosynthesis protein PgsC [Clostridia bacterium]|nr:poly-gamma-glutamate biosynthesis protein PgsC [Clostridia bacterium]
MYITEVELALIIGVIISLLFSEKFGITAGGIIVPAYLAMYFGDLRTVLIIYLVSFITFLIIQFILPKFVILYGRRKFVACIIIATVFKLAFEYLFPIMPFEVFEFRGISIIIPALLANTYTKQGVKLTVISSLGLGVLVFGIINLLMLI